MALLEPELRFPGSCTSVSSTIDPDGLPKKMGSPSLQIIPGYHIHAEHPPTCSGLSDHQIVHKGETGVGGMG